MNQLNAEVFLPETAMKHWLSSPQFEARVVSEASFVRQISGERERARSSFRPPTEATETLDD